MPSTRYAYLEASAKLSDTPTCIYSISFTTAANTVGVILYDALNANTERKIIHLHELTGRSSIVNFNPPLETENALYVELESNVDTCTIQYRKLST